MKAFTIVTFDGDDRVFIEESISIPAWIRTGDGDDVVFSGSGDDIIDTGAGRDMIWSRAGADTIDAGPGDDGVFAGNGKNTVFGGPGNDLIVGGQDDDVLYGGDGNDVIKGNGGDDELFGSDGNDVLIGGSGTDHLQFGSGDNILYQGDHPNLDEILGIPLPWPRYHRDINGDGLLTPIDAIIVINYLYSMQSGAVSSDEKSDQHNEDLREYVDTNRDGIVSAIDALLVINALNELGDNETRNIPFVLSNRFPEIASATIHSEIVRLEAVANQLAAAFLEEDEDTREELFARYFDILDAAYQVKPF